MPIYHRAFTIDVNFVIIYVAISLINDQCKKTFQFKTQCKGDISHAFETAKITVFYPTVCKTPDVPLQNELLC